MRAGRRARKGKVWRQRDELERKGERERRREVEGERRGELEFQHVPLVMKIMVTMLIIIRITITTLTT